MASITFSGVFLARADDPADYYYSENVSVSAAADKSGQFRKFAGGRVRLITQAGGTESVSLKTNLATQAQREGISAWRGQLCLYRDGRGRLMWGSFLGLDAAEIRGSQGYCSLSLTFVGITHSVEV